MKTLIILKGLVKRDKLDWVKQQELESFFLDYNAIRNIYSAPELLTPEKTILNFSYSDVVYRRFLEILCFRMSKGCLVVLDIENLTPGIVETLAEIFGYKIFWVVNKVPSDYLKRPQLYTDTRFPQKTKLEYKKDVQNYNNSIGTINSASRVGGYEDVENYWRKVHKKEHMTEIEDFSSGVIHVSDIHSNYHLFKSIEPQLISSKLGIVYGDYIDGPCNGGSRSMLDYVLNYEGDNVVWLEGNHESRLRKYLGSKYLESIGKQQVAELLLWGLSNDFYTRTAIEFSDLTPEEGMNYIRKMNEKLSLYHVISVPSQGIEYICTHSGFRYLDQLTPKFIGNVVYGSRNMDKIDRTFSEKVGKEKNKWSIHAHCKYPEEWKVNKYSHVMNIDPLSEDEIVIMTQTEQSWKVCRIINETLE